MIDKTFWKGKKVFITGHTGFKGSWLCMLLNYLEADVIGYSLDPPTIPSLFKEAKIDQIINHNIGDIRDLDRLKEVLFRSNPDILIHMAAQPLVRESYRDPVTTYQTNVLGTVNLLESARICNNIKSVVIVTTDKCYDNNEWVWGYRENDRLGGYDPYSNSKACSELVTDAYRNSFFNPEQYGIDHNVAIATARAGNVIGGGDWAEDRLVPDILKAIFGNKKVQIRNPYAVRPWQHVLEPLSGYLDLARSLYSNGTQFDGAWNFGPDANDSRPVKWIVEKMCSLYPDSNGYKIDQNTHPHEANYLKLDCSKALQKLLWTPVWTLETTLNKIIDWHLSYEKNQSIFEKSIEQIIEYCNDKESL